MARQKREMGEGGDEETRGYGGDGLATLQNCWLPCPDGRRMTAFVTTG